MRKLVILVICLANIFSNAYGYDSQKCTEFRRGDFSGGAIFSSTTSYISSTGDCAAIGYHSKENKEMFYVQNELELQLDIAKGEGAYLAELVAMYGCDESASSILNKSYSSIYSSTNSQHEIEKYLSSSSCKYL